MLKGYLMKVLIKADMLDYYNVSGCYVLKPWSYSIWEIIQGKWILRVFIAQRYFPMFVSQKVLKQEKDHIEGFSLEVAWVTRACVYCKSGLMFRLTRRIQRPVGP
jgi:prolyl-tRNA synthetase